MYADKITDSMQKTIDETERRRAKQLQYNKENGIVPTPIVKKSSGNELLEIYGEEAVKSSAERKPTRKESKIAKPRDQKNASPRPYIEEEHSVSIAADPVLEYMSDVELKRQAEKIQADMIRAARNTDFIEAARLRDELLKIRELIGEPASN